MGNVNEVRFTGTWKTFTAILDVAAMELQSFQTNEKIIEDKINKEGKEVAALVLESFPTFKKLKMTKKKIRMVESVIDPPLMPLCMVETIKEVEDTTPIWLMEKQLTWSDVAAELQSFQTHEIMENKINNKKGKEVAAMALEAHPSFKKTNGGGARLMANVNEVRFTGTWSTLTAILDVAAMELESFQTHEKIMENNINDRKGKVVATKKTIVIIKKKISKATVDPPTIPPLTPLCIKELTGSDVGAELQSFQTMINNKKGKEVATMALEFKAHPTFKKAKKKMSRVDLPLMHLCMMETIREIEGTTPIWLMEKQLKWSDVNPQLNRLFIHKSEVLEGFVTEEEKKVVVVNEESKKAAKNKKKIGSEEKVEDSEKVAVCKKKSGLEVVVVDPMGQLLDLDFKLWASVDKYVLTKQWTELVQKYRMEELDTVQLWSFRLPPGKDSKLCFAINIRRGADINGASSSSYH